MNKIHDILYSLKLNYKSWIFFMITIYLLSSKNYINGVFNLIFNFLIIYFGHYLLHVDLKKYRFLNFFKIIHEIHHKKHGWLIFFAEILLEFFSITFISFIKIFIQSICNINFFDVILNNVNIPLNIFSFILYTTVHYINYSYLHVTNAHELHHIDYFKNIFPDFFDILFSTKYKDNYKDKDQSYIENTDHYIPNIIISTMIIYIFLYFYNNYNYKKTFDYIFFFIYICVFMILSIVSIELEDKKHKKIIKKIKYKLKKYKNKLKKYKNKLKKYKNSPIINF